MFYDASNRVVDVIRGAHEPSMAITTHYECDDAGQLDRADWLQVTRIKIPPIRWYL